MAQYVIFLSCGHTIETPNPNVAPGNVINCGICRKPVTVTAVSKVP